MSVTGPSEPRVVDSATVSPPLFRLTPLASLSCTVIADVLVPLATMDVGLAVIVEVAAEGCLAWKVTVALSVIGWLFTVPVMVAVPAVAEDVSVAE